MKLYALTEAHGLLHGLALEPGCTVLLLSGLIHKLRAATRNSQRLYRNTVARIFDALEEQDHVHYTIGQREPPWFTQLKKL